MNPVLNFKNNGLNYYSHELRDLFIYFVSYEKVQTYHGIGRVLQQTRAILAQAAITKYHRLMG